MRFLTKFEQPIFEAPRGMAQFLLAANLIVFGFCFSQSGAGDIAPDILQRYGAMSTDAIERREYWRMIAYGFLHANPIHLAANMFLLILWGGHLEKRVGALYFAFVYFSGLLAGAVVSKFTASNGYLLIGASGALAAIFARQLCAVAQGSTRLRVADADRDLLARAGAVVGAPGQRRPFILEGAHLYQQRLLTGEKVFQEKLLTSGHSRRQTRDQGIERSELLPIAAPRGTACG